MNIDKKSVVQRSIIAVAVMLGLAWLIWEPLGLERHLQVVNAEKENQFIIDQHAFSPGKFRLILNCDTFDSTQKMIARCEEDFMNHYVPSGSYGVDWALEDSKNKEVIKRTNETLGTAGIKPGSVLKVVRYPKE